MSFVNPAPPGGWGAGAELTHGQANQLGSQLALALDKSVAGDQLQGVVTMGAGAALLANTAGAKIVSSVAGGIQATAPGAAVTTANNGFVSQAVNGGFELAGGVGDNPNYNPPRTIVRGRRLGPSMVIPSAWNSSTTYYLIGGGATGYVYCPLEGLIDGALLSSVTFQFLVPGAHGGGAPANPPLFSVFRYPISTGGTNTEATLNSGDATLGLPAFNTGSPPSGATWHNSGQIQPFVYTVNQNGIVNLEQFAYAVAIQDENGANSAGGNNYLATLSSMIVAQLTYD
jgi:hypothetical protein